MLDNLRSMAVFASVVRHGSFSGAAKELMITTSAVSQQVRSLESEFGVSLLHRSTRKVSLTEAGESLYVFASKMVQSAEEGRDKVNQLKSSVSGCLRMAILPQMLDTIMPSLYRWLTENHGLSVHFLAQDCKFNMIDDRVDLALSLVETPTDRMPVFGKVKQIIVVSPHYLNQKTPLNSLEDLAHHDFITCGDTDVLEVNHQGQTMTTKVNTRLSTKNPHIALRLCELGYGLTITSELEVINAINAGHLLPVLTDHVLPDLSLVAQTPHKDKLPIKVERSLALLSEYFSKHTI